MKRVDQLIETRIAEVHRGHPSDFSECQGPHCAFLRELRAALPSAPKIRIRHTEYGLHVINVGRGPISVSPEILPEVCRNLWNRTDPGDTYEVIIGGDVVVEAWEDPPPAMVPITARQHRILSHALGIHDVPRRPDSKPPYRNSFAVLKGNDDWDDVQTLARAGLMREGHISGDIHLFSVTEAGVRKVLDV